VFANSRRSLSDPFIQTASKPSHTATADDAFGGPDPPSVVDLYLAGAASMGDSDDLGGGTSRA